jgi:hypothetical protein
VGKGENHMQRRLGKYDLYIFIYHLKLDRRVLFIYDFAAANPVRTHIGLAILLGSIMVMSLGRTDYGSGVDRCLQWLGITDEARCG